MTDRAPAPPPTLEQRAESIRTRLIQHGQHGALAEFAAYVDAVKARGITVAELQELKPEVDPVGSAGGVGIATELGKLMEPAKAEGNAKRKAKAAK